MNKNWFYRVLALALVAMLAVPMFAFAEEDVLATAAEAPAEELATALEGEDEIEPKVTLVGTDIISIPLGVKVPFDGGTFDLNLTSYVQINLDNANGKKENFKSSNRKVATVSSTGVVFFVGVGTATITCTGYVDGYKKPLTSKIVFTVEDASEIDYLAGYFWDDQTDAEFQDLGEDLNVDKGSYTAYVGQGILADDIPSIHFQPVPFNSDHDWIGPGAITSGAALYEYMHGYSYKWSNSKVAFFDGNNHLGFIASTAPTTYGTEVDPLLFLRNASPVNRPFVSSAKFWMGPYFFDDGNVVNDNDLMPIFYKPGTSTLTIKTQATAGMKSKTYTNKITVEKEKYDLSLGSDKDLQKKADKAEAILFQLGTLDIQSMDKVVLTIKVYNGTGWSFPVNGLVFSASIDGGTSNFLEYNLEPDPDNPTTTVVHNNGVKGSVKAHKTSTITITFENKRDSDFNIKTINSANKLTGTPGTRNNTVYSRKFAQEIIAPYPDVWDPSFDFMVTAFHFAGTPATGTIYPAYAFTAGPLDPWFLP